MIKYRHQLQNYDFKLRTVENHRKKGTDRKTIYCDDIFTFDIEASSCWIDENGNVISYKKGFSDEYWNELEPLSLCYIWQFSVNDTVYYGRELLDLLLLLNDLPDANMVCYVHNLSFEFVALTNILTVKDVFAKSPHKPMKCNFVEFPKLEFRCSYFLTGMSLELWGDQLGIPKLVGFLDYDKMVRTPYTHLDDNEMQYAERDCIVVYEGIKKELETYNTVFDIPLTKTSKVRNKLKDLLYQDPSYKYFIKKLVPTVEDYQMLKNVYSGGYTHCNRYYADRVIKGKISHWDFTSSYPTVMVAKKYPCRRWVKRYEHYIPNDKTFDNYAFIMRLRFTNCNATTTNSYIQLSKCEHLTDSVRDNGRLVKGSFEILITEIDWLIIKDFYKWDNVELLDSWYSKKDYLPKAYIDFILTLYEQKTTLKGVSDDIIPHASDIYSMAKGDLNSLYGVSVTDICQSTCVYNEGLWYNESLTYNTVKNKLDKLKDPKRANDKKYFSNFAWGVYVCAYGRKALWDCIKLADPSKVIYGDTDSLFILGVPDFTKYNEQITKELKIACDTVGVDFAKTHPKDIKGIEHPLGIFDRDDDIIEYKCIHAKAYCERREDNKLYLTVSGVGKDAVSVLNNDINNFAVGTVFDKDFNYKKPKMIPTYLNDMPVVKYPDGYKSHYTKGINLRRTGYTIGNTDEFSKLLKFTQLQYEDLDMDLISKMKGVFR